MNYPTVAENASIEIASEKDFSGGRGGARMGALALLLAGALLAARPAAAAPKVELSDGFAGISRLAVGSDLYVGLRGADPNERYELRLLAADGGQIASLATRSDAAGALSPQLLWSRTGVVGCDCGAPSPNPTGHVFGTYEEAELYLPGKSVEVQVVSAVGIEVARVALPLTAAAVETVFFADADGCPRSYAKPTEPLYLGILHPDRSKPDRRFFFAVSKPWPLGEPIADVRGGAQIASVPALGGDLEVLPVDGWPLAGAPGVPASRSVRYDGVWRQGLISHPWVLNNDRVMAAPGKTPTGPEGNGGIVITMDGCTPASGTHGQGSP